MKLEALWATSPHFPLTTPAHGSLHSTLRFYDFGCLRFHIEVRSCSDLYLAFCAWLTSLSIMLSRFIHIVSNVRISLFLRMNNIPICVYMFPFICGLFHCFHILVILSNAAINTRMQISLQDPDFIYFEYVTKSEVSVSAEKFIFWRFLYCFP